jgi:hypothetical protein
VRFDLAGAVAGATSTADGAVAVAVTGGEGGTASSSTTIKMWHTILSDLSAG